MDSEERKAPDSNEGPETEKQNENRRTFNARDRFYGFLLLFIVVACVVLISIPSLRQRLMNRTFAIYRAVRGDRGPVMADMDAKQAPYPEEYKRPEYAFPDAGQVDPEEWALTEPSKTKNSTEASTETSLITPKIAEGELEVEKDTPKEPDSPGSIKNIGIRYTTEKTERDAYDLLLQTYPKVSDMVRDGTSSMKFQSWGGLRREGDVIWVRLIFTTEKGLEVEYIWEVNMKTRQIQPLSYNARTIS